MASRHVFVTATGDHYTQRIEARDHQMLADEPSEVGGQNAGPDPYELLLAALGSCTAMTIQMYAQKKQWPLVGVEVRLEHERVHARDCAECEETSGYIDRIRKRIEVRGDLEEEQRVRLLEIADRCPVHRTLTGAVRIESS